MEYKHRAGTWFRHYKGAYYATLEYDDVLHTETGEQLVLYRRMYPNPYSPNANTVFRKKNLVRISAPLVKIAKGIFFKLTL